MITFFIGIMGQIGLKIWGPVRASTVGIKIVNIMRVLIALYSVFKIN